MIALVAGCFVVAVFHDGAAHYSAAFLSCLAILLNYTVDEVIGVCVCVRPACLKVCSDAFSLPSQPSEKCGVLNVTKITEHGKKVR